MFIDQGEVEWDERQDPAVRTRLGHGTQQRQCLRIKTVAPTQSTPARAPFRWRLSSLFEKLSKLNRGIGIIGPVRPRNEM